MDSYPHNWPNKTGRAFDGEMDGLCSGKVYTIQSVAHDELVGHAVIFLLEIRRPICPVRRSETGFWIGRFRPLITKTQEQDIEMFRKIISQEPVQA